jgi:hypothetical protein
MAALRSRLDSLIGPGPIRLRRQVFSPRREFKRIERRARRALAEESVEFGVWESHQPVLITLLRALAAPRVLELGVGYSSTPIVLALSGKSVSLETDPDWVARFSRFATPKHEIAGWDDYDEHAWNCRYFDERWDVAFVDNSPASTRQGNAEQLRETARFLVCHDTEECFKPAGSSYGWDFSAFRFVWTCTRFDNYTTVASDSEPIPEALTSVLAGVNGQPPGRS